MSGGQWSYNRFDSYEKQLTEKKATKDYDGDGKVESSKEEYFGSKDKAIKKAMGKESKKDDCECKEEYVDENRQAAYTAGQSDAKKSMKSAPAKVTGGKTYSMKGKDGKPLFSEGSCGGGYQEGGVVKANKKKDKVVKEDVLEYMLENSLATNVVSAEVLFDHISDEFLESIEDEIMEGWKPMPTEKMARQAGKAYGKEQDAVKAGDEKGVNKQMQRRIAMMSPQGRKSQLTRKNSPMNNFKS